MQVRFFAPTLPELVATAEQARAKFAARSELTGITVSGGTPSREVIAGSGRPGCVTRGSLPTRSALQLERPTRAS